MLPIWTEPKPSIQLQRKHSLAHSEAIWACLEQQVFVDRLERTFQCLLGRSPLDFGEECDGLEASRRDGWYRTSCWLLSPFRPYEGLCVSCASSLVMLPQLFPQQESRQLLRWSQLDLLLESFACFQEELLLQRQYLEKLSLRQLSRLQFPHLYPLGLQMHVYQSISKGDHLSIWPEADTCRKLSSQHTGLLQMCLMLPPIDSFLGDLHNATISLQS